MVFVPFTASELEQLAELAERVRTVAPDVAFWLGIGPGGFHSHELLHGSAGLIKPGLALIDSMPEPVHGLTGYIDGDVTQGILLAVEGGGRLRRGCQDRLGTWTPLSRCRSRHESHCVRYV